MSLGNISDLMNTNEKDASAIRVPDLDWLVLTAEDKKNIPVPINIEVIPQLQENWKNTGEASTTLIPNQIKSEFGSSSDKITDETIRDVVYAAKKEMMKGLMGKALAEKLATTYPKNLIKAASEQLKTLAQEQGLLGNVYVDISPYDSCQEAAKFLGNKVKLAKYVLGTPRKHVCSSHASGYCKELHKNVIANMEYSPEVLKDYTTHLRIAGMIGPEDVIDSKEILRAALMRSAEDKKPVQKEAIGKTITKEEALALVEKFSNQVVAMAEEAQQNQAVARFIEIRPILAFIQDEMLKGKIGGDLKEVICKKLTADTIKRYEPEIRKVASLQGLLGNVYVDVSFYSDADTAIKTIKRASVSPSYLIQSYKKNKFDDMIQVVASSTGCEILPRDGKIDKKVATSYIDDLQFNNRISSDQANEARNGVKTGENILNILRSAFLNTLSYKPASRVGGVDARFYQEPIKKYANRDKLKEATYKAIEAGFPIEKIESKLIQQIPTAEAVSIVRKVIASVKEIDVNVLTKCTSEKYQFSHDVALKAAQKCAGCIYTDFAGCTKLGLRYAAKKEEKDSADKKEAPTANIDPHTEKVLFSENPDVTHMENINKEFEMPDYIGSNINVALDKMRIQKDASIGVDMTFNSSGIDESLKTL